MGSPCDAQLGNPGRPADGLPRRTADPSDHGPPGVALRPAGFGLSPLLVEARMLPRVLEPEVMDSPEEARDYDAMDHSHVNRVFVTDFLAVWRGRGPVLDVGTGTAQIPIELCRQTDAATVVGIDLAEHMLAVGRD